MGITVRTPSPRSLKQLEGLVVRVQDATPAWPAVGDIISRSVAQRFATQGSSGGAPWKPLSPEYAARKAKQRPGAKILVFNGGLRAEVTSRPMDIERYERRRATFGISSAVASYHQHGTRTMPARPILEATPAMTVNVRRAVRRWLLHGTVEP